MTGFAPDAARRWIRRAAWTYHHPVGTCAMGPAPGSGSVVDAAGALGAELPVPPDATPQTRFLAMLGRSELFSLP